jgi:hypothetical protein
MADCLLETIRGVSRVIIKRGTGHNWRGQVSAGKKKEVGSPKKSDRRGKNLCANNTIQARIGKSTINYKQPAESWKHLSGFIRIQDTV